MSIWDFAQQTQFHWQQKRLALTHPRNANRLDRSMSEEERETSEEGAQQRDPTAREQTLAHQDEQTLQDLRLDSEQRRGVQIQVDVGKLFGEFGQHGRWQVEPERQQPE
eukprot:857892-Rhodomonas_salina.3